MDYLNSYNTSVNSMLSPLDNPNITAFLKLMFILYGAMIAPKLPDEILVWFEYVPFKIFILSLIVWLGNHDPALAIIISIGLYISMNKLAGKKAFEKFENVE